MPNNLETLWNTLKSKGLFQNFATYAEYQEAQREKGIVDLKPKVGMMNPQPKADPIAQEAKKFDEQYGIDEYKDIDPKLIPF